MKGEREKNINMWLSLTLPLTGTWPGTQALALTGTNWRPLASQASTQSTEPAGQGLLSFYLHSQLRTLPAHNALQQWIFLFLTSRSTILEVE